MCLANFDYKCVVDRKHSQLINLSENFIKRQSLENGCSTDRDCRCGSWYIGLPFSRTTLLYSSEWHPTRANKRARESANGVCRKFFCSGENDNFPAVRVEYEIELALKLNTRPNVYRRVRAGGYPAFCACTHSHVLSPLGPVTRGLIRVGSPIEWTAPN